MRISVIRLVLALLCLTVVATAPAIADEWPQTRHDAANTGSSAEGTSAPWFVPTDTRVTSVVPANGAIHYRSSTGLTVLDLETRQERWGFRTELNPVEPVVTDARVYTTTKRGRIYARQGDGSLDWQFTIDGETWGSPAAVDGSVYLSSNGTVHGLSARSGDIRWSREVSGSVASSIAVNGDVYLRTYDPDTESSALYALDAATGQTVWRVTRTEGLGGPTLGGGRLYVPTETGDVLAVDEASGAEEWRRSLGVDGQSVLAYDGGTLYVTTGKQEVVALAAATGAVEWRHEAETKLRSAVAVRGGRVYAAKDEGLDAFDASSGRLLWSVTFRGDVSTSPVAGNGGVFMGTDHGVYAIGSRGQVPGAGRAMSDDSRSAETDGDQTNDTEALNATGERDADGATANGSVEMPANTTDATGTDGNVSPVPDETPGESGPNGSVVTRAVDEASGLTQSNGSLAVTENTTNTTDTTGVSRSGSPESGDGGGGFPTIFIPMTIGLLAVAAFVVGYVVADLS